MKLHVGGRLFLAAAVLGVAAVLTLGLFLALTVPSTVAGPGAEPWPPRSPVGHFWRDLEGHGVDLNGVYVNTKDDEALELRVNSSRALRLEPNATSPNVIGGYRGNSVTTGVAGAAIGGGGNLMLPNSVTADYGTVGGGQSNKAGYLAAVGGGDGNTASEWYSTVGGGRGNNASAWQTTVGGGVDNDATMDWATVGGGKYNIASGYGATVGGGSSNDASASYATVGGGEGNDATDNYCAVGGGGNNQAGNANAVLTDATYATVGGGSDNIASGDRATVGGGYTNTASGYISTVAGGRDNTASGSQATVGGGFSNTAGGFEATAGGGHQNDASGTYATVGGGGGNTASGLYATVPGGAGNTASGSHSTAMGRGITAAGDYSVAIALDNQTSTVVSQPNTMAIMGGNVGIGTTTPGARLDVTGGAGAYVYDTETFVCPINGGLHLRDEVADSWDTIEACGRNLQILPGLGKTYFSGNVGIGTPDPDNKLQVNGTITVGSATTAGCLKIKNTTAGWTWCTTSAGALSCSQVQPAACS